MEFLSLRFSNFSVGTFTIVIAAYATFTIGNFADVNVTNVDFTHLNSISEEIYTLKPHIGK